LPGGHDFLTPQLKTFEFCRCWIGIDDVQLNLLVGGNFYLLGRKFVVVYRDGKRRRLGLGRDGEKQQDYVDIPQTRWKPRSPLSVAQAMP
jgi:hypothetical protein